MDKKKELNDTIEITFIAKEKTMKDDKGTSFSRKILKRYGREYLKRNGWLRDVINVHLRIKFVERMKQISTEQISKQRKSFERQNSFIAFLESSIFQPKNLLSLK